MKINPAVRLQEVADFLSVPLKGDPNMLVSGLNEIHKVEPGDLTFVDVEKYYAKALNSAATFVIINKDVDVPEAKALLISSEPFRDYNRLVNKYRTNEMFYRDHFDQATNLKIGEGTRIYPGVAIADHVRIGRDCTIYPNVVIYPDTTIGDRVTIHANSVIGGDAFYFKNYKTHFEKLVSCGSTVIEDDVEIGTCCTIDRGVSGVTRIGKGTKFDNQIHIGHGVVIGERCLFAAQTGIGGKTIIEDEVVLWGKVGVNKDIRIGKGAVVLATGAVSKSLEGGKVYFGSPAQEMKKAYREIASLRMLPDIIEKLRL